MKTISFLGLSVMAVLSLAGCSNDELVETTVAGNYTLNASVEDFKNDSRAALTDDKYEFQWIADDEIGLLGTNMNNVKLSQNVSGSSKYGLFSGNVPAEGVPVVAYFPYEENVNVTLETAVGTGTSKGNFSITLPAVATDDMKAPMCGDVIGNKVSFQHLCALLKVTIHDIPTEAAKLVLTSSNQALTGKANIKYVDGSYVLEMDANSTTTTGKEITYSLTSSGTKTFLFSIPPASEAYDKLTVSLQKADGGVIEEKGLTNTIFTAGSICVTPAFSAKAAEQVTSLADVSGKFTDTPNVTVTGTINTSNGNATVTIPQSDQPLNLTFQNAPVASANNPIKIEGTSASIVTLAVPVTSTSGAQSAADYTINTKAEITCAAAPASASGGGRSTTEDTNCYNYGKITVKDVKEITIARDVKVEILEIEASTTVKIYGYVKEVVPKKTADEISIINRGGTIGNRRDIAKWSKGTATITGSRSVFASQRGYISEWDGSLLQPELTQDGNTYEIFDASELAWFQNKTSLSTTASNISATIDKNAILYVDIDLKNRPWKGMVLGQNCMFDGGDCTISNLAIKEFILNEQSIYTPNACLGLFGAAMQGAGIKNLTLDKVAMTAAAKWAGALVGLSYGAVSYEKCIAKNVTITANDFYSYRVGGLIGFIAAINDKNVTISNCHTENVGINASYALGGLIGTIQGSQTVTISNSSVKQATMTMSNSFENWLSASDWNSANGKPADYIGYMGGFIGDPGMRNLTITNCSVSSVNLLNGHFDLYTNEAGKAFIGGNNFLGRVDYPENATINLNSTTLTAGVDYNKFEN